MNKDFSILDFVENFRSEDLTVVDHWDADLCAIGYENPKYPNRLAYISTYGKKPGQYYLKLEEGTKETEFETIGLDELRGRIFSHLNHETRHAEPVEPGNGYPAPPVTDSAVQAPRQ